MSNLKIGVSGRKILQPVHDKIVVKPLEKDGNEDITESGIILPDSVHGGKLIEGEVLEVSKGMYSTTGDLIPSIFKVGDIVVYPGHHRAQEYKLNGEDVYIMSSQDVISILEDEPSVHPEDYVIDDSENEGNINEKI